MPKSGAELRRDQIRENFFSKDDLLGEKEKGWFPVLRTMPLILSLIDSKPISGTKRASLVYLELLSRHRSDGVIEMSTEADHAYAAGYQGPRAVRSWQERVKTLEKNGFIRVRKVGNEPYKYVALLHPSTAVKKLRDAGKVPDTWWDAYFTRRLETKELTYEQRMDKLAAANVVPITPPVPFTVSAPFAVPKPTATA